MSDNTNNHRRVTRRISIDVRKFVYLAVLTAIVFVLQMFAPMINFFGLSPALVLVPLVVGVALCGTASGAWLGSVFAIVVLTTDPTVAPFYNHNFIATVVLVLLKSILAGVVAGVIYKLLSRKNKYVAILVAAVAAPVVNTAVFVVGCLLFFAELTGAWAILGLFIAPNFIAEVVINVVLVPAIYKIIEVVSKK